MKTKIVDINSLNPAEYNPRIELKEGMEEWDSLNNSLNKFGLVVPIVINEKNNTIISGHQRIAALKSQGKTSAEAVVLNLDEENEKQLNIALNKIQGKWDFDKLDQMLEEMTEEEKKYTGFWHEEIEQPEIIITDKTPAAQKEKPFYIYVSFDDESDAEQWKAEHSLKDAETNRNNYIEME